MNLPELSICIPTYNRASNVESLVRTVLTSSDPFIEVVVLDNASTDDTISRLRAITDPRLSIHVNEVNRGVIFNILNVLDRAQGRFAALLLDKDGVHPKSLPGFRRFLMAHDDLGCGYCEYDSKMSTEALCYGQGLEALEKVGYVGHHPTGYFFNTEMLRSIGYLERFSDFEFVGHFPFDFIFAELALLGSACIYNPPTFFPESIDNAAKHKSIGTNAGLEDAFFSPKGRLKTAINFARHAATLSIDSRQKQRLVAQRFVQGLLAATIGYRSVMANSQLCSHYHIASRRIGFSEMSKFAAHFYWRFLSQAVHVSGRSRLNQFTRFHLEVARICGARLLRKRAHS